MPLMPSMPSMHDVLRVLVGRHVGRPTPAGRRPHIAETGQRLIAYCAAPGSATEAAFGRLADHTAARA